MTVTPFSAAGTAPAAPQKTRTALQKHIDYFDRNGDGEIKPLETYRSCRKLGMGVLLSAGAAVAINAALGVKSGSPWYKFLTIQTEGIHHGKHEGDTGVYDKDGQFVQQKFDEMWQKHDKNGDNALSQQEIEDMMVANGNGKASTGSKLEFRLLLKLAGEDTPDGRVLTRSRMESFYDGSLFYTLAGEKAP